MPRLLKTVHRPVLRLPEPPHPVSRLLPEGCSSSVPSVPSNNDATDRELPHRLVQMYKLQQSTCQAKDGSNPCKRLAFQHCEHCSRDMCQVHYCEDRLEFEKSCKQAIANAEFAAEIADSNTKAVIKEWDSLTNETIKELEKRRSKIHSMISTASSASKLRADANALRKFLDAGDLKEAISIFKRLTETTNNSMQSSGLAGLRPRALVHVELRDAVKDIERLCLSNKESK